MKAASSGMRNFIKGAVVVAAVAGLGLLGYYGYKKYKNRPQPRKRMRAYLRARYVTNNFYKAYSYFGPDFKAKISKREYVTARENVPYEIRKLREGIKPRIMEFNKSGDTVSATVVLKDVPDLKKAMAQQMEDLSLKEVSKMSDMSEKRSRRKFWEGLDPETVPRKNIEKKFYMSYINGKWWVDGDPTEVETDK